jgi:hypothetical protein
MSALTILTDCVGRPLTKRLERGPDGQVVKVPAQMPRFFKASQRVVSGLDGLAETLTELADDPTSFVIRGEPMPWVNLGVPVRRLKYRDGQCPATFRSATKGRQWVCFDFDKVPYPKGDVIDPVHVPQSAFQFLDYMLPEELHDISFWAQWSSGAGVNGWEALSAHLWFWLDEPVTDDELHDWAVEHPNAPIDRRLFNAVQPHFTASPIIGSGVLDPCPVRHGIVRGRRGDTVSLNLQPIWAAA